MSPQSKAKIRFFVSYAHDDYKKKKVFLKFLQARMSNSRNYEYELWTDQDLLPGENWREEIRLALRQCEAGILLVSPFFLASEFINKEELCFFLNNDKPYIPIALFPVNFGGVDMKGLGESQIFRWRQPESGNFKEFSACRNDARFHFVDQLVEQIEQRLEKRSQGLASAPTTAGSAKPAGTPENHAQVEQKMRVVFGRQFDAIRRLMETNESLRNLLRKTFITNAENLNHDQITHRLMFRFYENFCACLGEMDRLYRQSGNRPALLETLSSIIFLAMSPEFVEKLRAGGTEKPTNIPEDARQGVVGLIRAWIQGDNTMPIRELAAQQNHEMWDVVPGDERNEIMEQIMKRTPGVDPDKNGAEERFRRITRAHANRKTYIHAIVNETQLAALGGDLTKGGLLENVLVFAKAAGETIFQERGEGYDADFEIQLDLLLETVNKYQ